MEISGGHSDPVLQEKSAHHAVLVAVVSLVVGAMLALAGCYSWKSLQSEFPADNVRAKANPHFPYQILAEPIYKNDDLGFSVEVPPTWTQYAIREDNNWPNIVITIGLPLENADSARYLSYPESRAQVIDIARFQATPISLWESEKGSCEEVAGPCFENDVIASSTSYVFSTVYPRPHAGWGFADDYGSSEAYVGAVWDDFDLGRALTVFEPVAR